MKVGTSWEKQGDEGYRKLAYVCALEIIFVRGQRHICIGVDNRERGRSTEQITFLDPIVLHRDGI